MANLFPKHTGLPFVIWISTCLGVPHDVLLKVARGENARPVEFITVGIRPKPHVINGSLSSEELQLLTNWIEVNREVIMQYWENKIDTVDALSRLRKV